MKRIVCAVLLAGAVLHSTVESAIGQSSKGVWDARQQSGTQQQSANVSRQGIAGAGRRLMQQYTNPYANNYNYNGASQQQAGTRQFELSKRQGNNVPEVVLSGGLSRRYLVHLPPSYGQNRSRSYPVVLVFHGAGMGIDSMRGLTLMDPVADRNDFLAVYPEGVSGGWNAGGLRSKSNENDVAFVADLLKQLESKYSIDRQAIFACGISNGGQMVQRLACDMSDRIAAIGVVAITGIESICKACSARRAVPVIFYIGTEDPLCPREGGGAKQLGKLGESLGLGDLAVTPQLAKFADIMTADEVVDFWCQHNGAGSPRQERLPDRDTRDGCTVTKETYGGGDREVICYTITGGGHTWPGGMGWVVEGKLGKTCNDISASQTLWDFFQTHRKR